MDATMKELLLIRARVETAMLMLSYLCAKLGMTAEDLRNILSTTINKQEGA